MNKKWILTAAVLAAGFVQAADINFLGADSSGSGDLSDPNHWDGGVVPTSETTAFTLPGELKSSAEKSFTGTATVKTSGPIVFNLANPVTFTTIRGWQDNAQIVVSNGTTLTATTFDLSEKSKGSSVSQGGSKLVVTGSGTRLVSPAKSGKIATGRGSGNSMEVQDGAAVSTYVIQVGSTTAGAAESGHKLKIGAGSTVTAVYAGSPFLGAMFCGYSSFDNVVDIYGTYDQQQGEYNYAYVGYNAESSNNVVTVHDGGVLQFKGLVYIGYSGCSNVVVVKRGGSYKDVSGNINRGTMLGEGVGSSNNLFKVEAGATLSNNKPIFVGRSGSYNIFDYENPTYMPQCIVGNSTTSTGNLAHFHGDGIHSFNGTMANLSFGAGVGNTVLMENFAFSNANNAAVSAVKPGNRLIFRKMLFHTGGSDNWSKEVEGSIYEFDNSTWTHYAGGSQHRTLIRSVGTTLRFENNSAASMWNVYLGDAAATNGCETLEVRSGSTVTTTLLYLHNSNNRFVISNATLNINQSFAELTRTTDKYSGGVGAFSTNLVIRFEGDTPKLASNQAAVFAYTAGAAESDPASIGYHVLEYVLPEQPYAVTPFTATSISLPKTTKVRVTKPGKCMTGRRYKLAEATGTGKNDKVVVADLAELGSELPEGCSLYLSDDQKSLWLRVRGDGGLMMLVR